MGNKGSKVNSDQMTSKQMVVTVDHHVGLKRANSADNSYSDYESYYRYQDPTITSVQRYGPVSSVSMVVNRTDCLDVAPTGNQGQDVNNNNTTIINSHSSSSSSGKNNNHNPAGSVNKTVNPSKAAPVVSKCEGDKCSNGSATTTATFALDSGVGWAPDRSPADKHRSTKLEQYSNKLNQMIDSDSYTSGRHRSGLVYAVFLVELLVVVAFILFAYFLRFTDVFSVVHRDVRCDDTSINLPEHNHIESSVIFARISQVNFYILFGLVPIILIIVLEFLRRFISSSSDKSALIIAKLNLKVPFFLRRIIRFSSRFLAGFLATSILVDILKLQIGSFRPYFIDLCSNITESCGINNSLIISDPETLCPEKVDEFRTARMSFPSIHASLSVYAALFTTCYLTMAYPYRPLRLVRLVLVMVICTGALLVCSSRVTTNQNHTSDVITGMVIGAVLCLYIVFMHLNAFTNRIASTNLLSAKRDSKDCNPNSLWINEPQLSYDNLCAQKIQIPRVQMSRQHNPRLNGAKNGRIPNGAQDIELSSKSTGAYINPAFEARDDHILENHLHHEMTLTRDNTAGGTIQRQSLQTFQSYA